MQLRLASLSDLPALKKMMMLVIQNMDMNGIHIWNEFYPYEEFENDIQKGELYVMLSKQRVVGVFAVSVKMESQNFFKWQDKDANALYLCRLAVHPNFAGQGYATQALDEISKITKEKGFLFLRLTVAEINRPAIKFYQKNGFTQVDGVFNEFSPTLNKTIAEYGFERKIV